MSENDGLFAERPPRVLVIEPDGGACRDLTCILEEAGAYAMTAERGLQGIELFLRERVDLVLSTLDLPDLNGVEVLKRVAKRSSSVRVALMAPWRSRSQYEELMQSGVFVFLRKPVREHEVLRMLGRLKAEVEFLE